MLSHPIENIIFPFLLMKESKLGGVGLDDLFKVTAVVYGDPRRFASGTVSVLLAQKVSGEVPPCSNLRILLPLKAAQIPAGLPECHFCVAGAGVCTFPWISATPFMSQQCPSGSIEVKTVDLRNIL